MKIFLIRNFPKEKRKEIKYINENIELKTELDFYKSLFITNRGSLIDNLRDKRNNGKRVWIDKLRTSRIKLLELDQDDEIKEWLKPIKCER